MADASNEERVRTRIWREEPEPGDRFTTRAAYCRGYDVYNDLVGQASWVDMLWLLFRGEAPSRAEASLLEALAVALANPGPRDPAVHAAMCAGVGGSPSAAALMAALAVGAGRHGGAQEVLWAMVVWQKCADDPLLWPGRWRDLAAPAGAIWPETEHPPGFDPHGTRTAGIVVDALQRLARLSPGPLLPWLVAHRSTLETMLDRPLAMTGVAAAALCDLGFSPEQGELLHLLLRLPGAAAHALEQRTAGYKNFPFFGIDLQDDPLKEAA